MKAVLQRVAPLLCLLLAGLAFVSSGFYLAAEYVPPPRPEPAVTYETVLRVTSCRDMSGCARAQDAQQQLDLTPNP